MNDNIVEKLVLFMLKNRDWKTVHFDGSKYVATMKDGTEIEFGGDESDD